MPTYNFINTETGEQYSEFMSMSEREKYLKENPHVTQTVAMPPVISGANLKPDEGFRDLLKEMKKKHSQGITKSTINTF